MPPVGGNIRAVAVHEPGAHIGARLEAFRVDVRTQVGVERCGRSGRRYAQLGGVARGQEPRGLPGDAGYRPAPAGVDDGEAPRGRGEHHRHAVGEAQQRRNLRHVHEKAVGPLERAGARGFDGGGLGRGQLHYLVAVHLARHHEGRLPRAECLQQKLLVARHGRRVVAHVPAQVERGVRPLAHAARAAGERDAHAGALEQGLVGERR